jgi:cytochrome c oxidase subunit 2
VEGDAAQQLEVRVVGIQFGWEFHYPNGAETFNELRVPQGEVVRLRVTSGDVWHNFGIPALRVKADSIPGQYSETWFIANETGTYTANCYELCGRGHSDMNADVIVMENESFDEWYENQAAQNSSDSGDSTPTPSGDDGESGSSSHRIAGPAGVVAA